jgi:hypothetical protein
VNYETDKGNRGTTDSEGKFLYTSKDLTITFKVDGLIIAENFKLSSINSDGIVLPVDIVNEKSGVKLDRNNTSDPRVIKFLRVLQSLDNNNNPSDGIVIKLTDGATISGNIIDNNIDTLKTAIENA